MPCITKLCNNPNPGLQHSISYRGRTYWVCTVHDTQNFEGGVFANQLGASPAHKEDARKLYIATSSAQLFDGCMQALVEESARRHGNELTWRWRMEHEHFHLSKELKRYEFMCWFGDQQKIFAGLLSAQESVRSTGGRMSHGDGHIV